MTFFQGKIIVDFSRICSGNARVGHGLVIPDGGDTVWKIMFLNKEHKEWAAALDVRVRTVMDFTRDDVVLLTNSRGTPVSTSPILGAMLERVSPFLFGRRVAEGSCGQNRTVMVDICGPGEAAALKRVLDFIYRGESFMLIEELYDFLTVAEKMRIYPIFDKEVIDEWKSRVIRGQPIPSSGESSHSWTMPRGLSQGSNQEQSSFWSVAGDDNGGSSQSVADNSWLQSPPAIPPEVSMILDSLFRDGVGTAAADGGDMQALQSGSYEYHEQQSSLENQEGPSSGEDLFPSA